METQKLSLYKHALKYGLLLGGINIVFAVILAVLKFHYKNNIAQLIFPTIMVIVISVIGIYNYKKKENNVLKLAEAIKIGCTVAFVAAILIVSYQLVFTTFIEPDFYIKSHEINRQALFDAHSAVNPGMTWKQFDIDMEEARNQFWKLGYTFTIVGYTFFGFIVALVAGLILRKR